MIIAEVSTRSSEVLEAARWGEGVRWKAEDEASSISLGEYNNTLYLLAIRCG